MNVSTGTQGALAEGTWSTSWLLRVSLQGGLRIHLRLSKLRTTTTSIQRRYTAHKEPTTCRSLRTVSSTTSDHSESTHSDILQPTAHRPPHLDPNPALPYQHTSNRGRNTTQWRCYRITVTVVVVISATPASPTAAPTRRPPPTPSTPPPWR